MISIISISPSIVIAKIAGAVDGGKMTSEAVLVKARLLLAQPEFNHSQETFRRSLVTDFAGETGAF